MVRLIIALIATLCLSNPGYSRVKELSLEVRKLDISDSNRLAYYPEKRDWRGYVGLNWSLDWDLFYWENTTYFYGDDAQVRHIGWKYKIGVPVIKGLDIFYYHHSEHSADQESPTGDRFPLEDSVGLKINFLDI